MDLPLQVENNGTYFDSQKSSIGVFLQSTYSVNSGNTPAHLGNIHQKIPQSGLINGNGAAV